MAKIEWGSPYTHEEHVRESHYHPREAECDWCGQKRKTLYSYENMSGQFCNKDCWRSYHS